MGDEHYRIAKNSITPKLDNFQIHAPFRNPRKPKDNKKKKKELTPRQKSYNKQISDSRGIVETPFGEHVEVWKCFKEPFNGSDIDFDNIVYFASGMYNLKH